MAKTLKFIGVALIGAVLSAGAMAAPKAEAKGAAKVEAKGDGKPSAPSERSYKGEAKAGEHARGHDRPGSTKGEGIGHGVSRH